MDEAGAGSTGPTVGSTRGEDKRNYPGPQLEAKDDSDH
jgi:hypothetical protein